MNADLQVETIGDYLLGRTIALCVTGGIAAIETPKLARQLRRYGARVQCYVTTEAEKFIGRSALEWATERPVISELSGLAEHICREEAVLIAPATANTISKIVHGIADNPVTALAASALGMNKPVYIAPTMHESLYQNPFFLENYLKAAEHGIRILLPREGEGKRKMPYLDTMVARMCHDLGSHPIRGTRILVTGGPTPVKIDSIRRITNIFKGTLAVEIAREAYLLGAQPKLLLGESSIAAPSYIPTERHTDYDTYVQHVLDTLSLGYDAGIFSAAVADYRPVQEVEGKIPSRGALKTIQLTETQKVIGIVRESYPELYMVTFKYELGVSKDELFDIARHRLAEGYQAVVANRGEDMTTTHRAYIFKGDEVTEAVGKHDIARKIVDLIGSRDAQGRKQ